MTNKKKIIKNIEKSSKKLIKKTPKKIEKRRPIDKNVKAAIWKIYNGNIIEGKCYVCGELITITNFDAGHNIAVANGGDDNITNLRPLCRSCNGSMGIMDIEDYKNRYFKIKIKKETTMVEDIVTAAKKLNSFLDLKDW